MKVAKVLHHGRVRFRVNEPTGPHGKRKRSFFATREEADRYVKERTSEVRAFGMHFASIPVGERATIASQLQRLQRLGWTLTQAVDFVESRGRPPAERRLGEVADEFFTAKAAAGLRSRYLKTLRASINRFLLNRREKLLHEVTSEEILEYIACNGWLPTTMRSYLVDVRTLFAFAVKRKYLKENPALSVDLPKVEETPPGIVTVPQARAILDACIDRAPDILPVLVLSLFGGLRRSEAEQLEWSEISEEFIEVKAHKAKTRRRRLIPISSQLRAWLETARAVGSALPALNYAGKLKAILEATGLRREWPQNALRHSFASYHFARHKNENETAALMGNSPQMVFRHYRELVRPAEAEAFFSIFPPADAIARSAAARLRRPRVVPPRKAKITAATMDSVFEAGTVSLTRRDAAARLCGKASVSVAAAYNALSPNGRFATSLSEAAGLLTWCPETRSLKIKTRAASEAECNLLNLS